MPSAFSTTVPFVGPATSTAVRPLSASVSFVSTFPDTALSSSVVNASSTATGASFTGVTNTV